jgi:hypothetical protein
MGSEVGDCFDTAVIEAFWSRMQVDLPHASAGERDPSSPTPSTSTEYLDIFHNRQRGFSALGMLTLSS